MQSFRLQDISKHLERNIWELFGYEREINLVYNFDARLWNCYEVTMNSPQTFFVKLTQRWCNIVIPTSRRRCEFDAFNVVTRLPLQHPWYVVRLIDYPILRQRWQNVVNLAPYYRRWEDVVNLRLWLQSCKNVTNTAFTVYHELNLLSNERWSNTVILTMWIQSCSNVMY